MNNSQKTHCIHGHEFCESNIIYKKRGDKIHRHCKTCANTYWRNRQRRLNKNQALVIKNGNWVPNKYSNSKVAKGRKYELIAQKMLHGSIDKNGMISCSSKYDLERFKM